MVRWLPRWLVDPYRPAPDEQSFRQRRVIQKDDHLEVHLAVLDDHEAERFFGVHLDRRGMQAVWLKIRNHGDAPYRLRLAALDPGYYPPLEAAYLNHFAVGKRVVGLSLLACLIFLPLLLLLPWRIVTALRANRRMNAYFEAHAIGWGLIRPGCELAGFVFTNHDEGLKQVTVRLLSTGGSREFHFSVPVRGRKLDHDNPRLGELLSTGERIECDEAELRRQLSALPACTTNRTGRRSGDPLNLIVVGDFDLVRRVFGGRWDETEPVSAGSCARLVKAFLLGRPYRHSPVSSLYVDGRNQDFALQRARQTVNQRLHLRLWVTRLRFQGKPVWIGQVSRDIGVRMTFRAWNLTTHRIDPDVDDARDYLIDDLLEGGRVSRAGYVRGVGAATPAAPRRNLTGDPYVTDGLRALVGFADAPTTPTFLDWIG